MQTERQKPIETPIELSDLLQLKALVMRALRAWMEQEGFLETFYPEITPVTGSCETIANIFVLQERELLPLRQTAQLAMEELLIVSQLPRMFTSGRSFRRERGGDGRHLRDFELFEWEALDIGLEKLLRHNESILEYVIKQVLHSTILKRDRKRTLYYWFERWQKSRPRITYARAIEILQMKGCQVKIYTSGAPLKIESRLMQLGDDLTAEAEQLLTDEFGIVQVTHYPESIKFFNMERSRDQQQFKGCVECVDLLLPYAGETIGGSAREYDYGILCEKLQSSLMLHHLKELNRKRGGIDEEIGQAFDSYLALFKNTSYPRAGAGLGLGRLLQFLTASNVIIPF